MLGRLPGCNLRPARCIDSLVAFMDELVIHTLLFRTLGRLIHVARLPAVSGQAFKPATIVDAIDAAVFLENFKEGAQVCVIHIFVQEHTCQMPGLTHIVWEKRSIPDHPTHLPDLLTLGGAMHALRSAAGWTARNLELARF